LIVWRVVVGVRHPMIVQIGCEIVDMYSLWVCLTLSSAHGREGDRDTVAADAWYKGGGAS